MDSRTGSQPNRSLQLDLNVEATSSRDSGHPARAFSG